MPEHLQDVLGMLSRPQEYGRAGVPEVVEAHRDDPLVRYGEGVHTRHINTTCRYVPLAYNQVVVWNLF